MKQYTWICDECNHVGNPCKLSMRESLLYGISEPDKCPYGADQRVKWRQLKIIEVII